MKYLKTHYTEAKLVQLLEKKELDDLQPFHH